MPDVGVWHGLACMSGDQWVWGKLVVMSEALRNPSFNQVLYHAT